MSDRVLQLVRFGQVQVDHAFTNLLGGLLTAELLACLLLLDAQNVCQFLLVQILNSLEFFDLKLLVLGLPLEVLDLENVAVSIVFGFGLDDFQDVLLLAVILLNDLYLFHGSIANYAALSTVRRGWQLHILVRYRTLRKHLLVDFVACSRRPLNWLDRKSFLFGFGLLGIRLLRNEGGLVVLEPAE